MWNYLAGSGSSPGRYGKIYRSYYTHENDVANPNTVLRKLHSRVRLSYLRTKYNYSNAGTTNSWDRLLAVLPYFNPIRRANLDLSVFYLECKPFGKLLELGCGSGSMLKSMKELGWQVEGLDFDLEAVQRAREKGLTVHHGTLAEQNFSADSFDAICASHLIEHVAAPLELLKECQRILKPGGFLVLLTPNAQSWGHRIYGADWRGLEPPRHFGIFTSSAMAAITRQAGLKVVQCRSTVRASYILSASKMLRRNVSQQRTRSLPWTSKVWEEARTLIQWAVSSIDPTAGEEVLLIAQK